MLTRISRYDWFLCSCCADILQQGGYEPSMDTLCDRLGHDWGQHMTTDGITTLERAMGNMGDGEATLVLGDGVAAQRDDGDQICDECNHYIVAGEPFFVPIVLVPSPTARYVAASQVAQTAAELDAFLAPLDALSIAEITG